MQISFAPLYTHGAIDLETNHIFISNRLSLNDALDTLAHELAHWFNRSPHHDAKWLSWLKVLSSSSITSTNNVSVGNISWNIGNISGIQNMLLDYDLLLRYRKFSQRVLGTEGRWDFVDHNKIRLHPNPKGTFPVVVVYIPNVNQFKSPNARQICMNAFVAETKIMLGNARRKFASFPSPDGGTITLDGAALVQEGIEEKKKAEQDAILLGEPLMIHIA